MTDNWTKHDHVRPHSTDNLDKPLCALDVETNRKKKQKNCQARNWKQDDRWSMAAVPDRTHTHNLDAPGLSINSALLSKDDPALVLLASCALAEGSLRLNANLRPASLLMSLSRQ